MTKLCYFHDNKEAFKECESCGRNICHDCSRKYWHTNAISSMFLPQKSDAQQMTFCPKCLKRARIKSGLISGTLLFLVIGTIIASIVFAVIY
ncbi:MAG: hypothetical protein KAS63_09700 [Candidatus Heimdallarchaeota archaeon]|nr:hypothetical protein [Candidatus Heimdallarchaeota archaeon]MCK4955624.1 hypothetical protein [Candidatus Heimdallarchaeota archaeon]